MENFLSNFHLRMEKLSYTFLIDNKASTMLMFKNHFNEMELINIIYTLLVFILEKSLRDEECTLSDMAEFLLKIINRYYHDITETDTTELTRNIVYRILRNDGKPFVFETINYNTGEKEALSYHLVQQKPSKIDNNKSTFYLEKEGYRLLLSTYEIDEKTQIDINLMVLELSLKKKNFAQGVMAVEELDRRISAQIRIISNFIYRMRENIFTITHEEFAENYLKNINVLREQNNKFEELHVMVVNEENRIYNAEKEVIKDRYDSLVQLGKIRVMLKRISERATSLIQKHFQFKVEYNKALEDASMFYNQKHFSIKEELLKPVEKDAKRLGLINRIYNPLFNVSIPKKFNINYMFNEQLLYLKEDDEIVKEFIVVEPENDTNEKLRKSQKEYEDIVNVLIDFIMEKENTSLQELIEVFNHKADDEYHRLVPSVRKFSEVLIELMRIGTIDLEGISEEEKKKYIVEDIEFDLRKILVEKLKTYRLRLFRYIYFVKDLNSMRVEVKERNNSDGEFKHLEVLTCPNILMWIGSDENV